MEKHDLKGGLWNLLISLAAALGAGMLLVTGTSTAVAVKLPRCKRWLHCAKSRSRSMARPRESVNGSSSNAR